MIVTGCVVVGCVVGRELALFIGCFMLLLTDDLLVVFIGCVLSMHAMTKALLLTLGDGPLLRRSHGDFCCS